MVICLLLFCIYIYTYKYICNEEHRLCLPVQMSLGLHDWSSLKEQGSKSKTSALNSEPQHHNLIQWYWFGLPLCQTSDDITSRSGKMGMLSQADWSEAIRFAALAFELKNASNIKPLQSWWIKAQQNRNSFKNSSVIFGGGSLILTDELDCYDNLDCVRNALCWQMSIHWYPCSLSDSLLYLIDPAYEHRLKSSYETENWILSRYGNPTFMGLNLPLGISSHGSKRAEKSFSSFFTTFCGKEFKPPGVLKAGELCRLAGAWTSRTRVVIDEGTAAAPEFRLLPGFNSIPFLSIHLPTESPGPPVWIKKYWNWKSQRIANLAGSFNIIDQLAYRHFRMTCWL